MDRGRLIEAIRIPFLLLIAVPIVAMLNGFPASTRDGMKLGLIILPIVSALAVGVHRVVLLSPVDAFASGEGFTGGIRRIIQYALAAMGLLVAFLLVSHLVMKGVLRVLAMAHPRTALTVAVIAGSGVAALALSRVFLVLPATAVNSPRPLHAAWHLSRTGTIRILFVVVAIPWITIAFFRLMFPRGTTWPQFIALTVLAAMLTVTHIAALSFTFRAVSARAPPPSDPPA